MQTITIIVAIPDDMDRIAAMRAARQAAEKACAQLHVRIEQTTAAPGEVR